MELVSVVIPTHNRSELIKNAVSSVLSQTYKNIELIIVDDASTDKTEEVVKSLDQSKIRYIKNEEAKGGNYARNLGISSSKGKYVAFLDDDDEWMPEKVADQVALFEEDQSIGLVYTGAEIIYTSKNYKYIRQPKHRGDLSKEILMRNYIGTTSSVMVKRSLLEKVGGFDNDMPALQDYDLWIRIAQVAQIGYINKPLIKYYNYTNINQITDNVHKIEKAINKIDIKYKNLIATLDKKAQEERYYQRFNGFGKRKLRIGEKKQARDYFIQSFKIKPNLTSIKFLIVSFLQYDVLVKLKSLIK